jgi:hypothetical protein
LGEDFLRGVRRVGGRRVDRAGCRQSIASVMREIFPAQSERSR